MIDLQKALETAKSAAFASGAILQERQGTALHINTKKDVRDLVTEVDGIAQKAIIDIIRSDFPDHGFIAEEEEMESGDSPYTWIIDPLDGTMNFIRGRQECGVLIALDHEGELQLGVILLPFLKQCFTGARGQGVFLNDEPLHKLRETKNAQDAVICTNIRMRAIKKGEGTLSVTMPECASLQNMGCAAYEMKLILEGSTDGVAYDGTGLWDIAAGCMLLEEMGGKYRYTLVEEGHPHAGVQCVASTAPIFDDLCAFIF